MAVRLAILGQRAQTVIQMSGVLPPGRPGITVFRWGRRFTAADLSVGRRGWRMLLAVAL